MDNIITYEKKPSIVLEKEGCVAKIMSSDSLGFNYVLIVDNEAFLLDFYSDLFTLEESEKREKINISHIIDVANTRFIENEIKEESIAVLLKYIKCDESKIIKSFAKNKLFFNNMMYLNEILINANKRNMLREFYFFVKFFGGKDDLYLLNNLKSIIS